MTEGALSGLTAVVTGASSGIGEETVRVLAREGADVVLAARREERLREVADGVEAAHDAETLVVPTDVQDEDAVAGLVDAAAAQFGSLDVVVANAGLARGNDVESMTTEEYRAMQDTNVDGVFFLTRAALPYLKESEGHLVFVGSYAGEYPRPYNPVYAGTKWWMRGFAKSVSGQVGEHGVGVTVVNPAAVRTEFELDGTTQAERFAPGEVVEPVEVAEAIGFAAEQSPSMVHEISVYERDKLSSL
jgi:NADP-dependent 3-hydroxy acid dehydrogenase YdfG